MGKSSRLCIYTCCHLVKFAVVSQLVDRLTGIELLIKFLESIESITQSDLTKLCLLSIRWLTETS
jgi:hypothetical protein